MSQMLYDFLYRDTARLASFAAQLFRGAPISREEADSVKRSEEETVTGGIDLKMFRLGGTAKEGDEYQASNRQTFDIKELICTDTILKLIEWGKVDDDFANSPDGTIVKASGTIMFIDPPIAKLAKGLSSNFPALAGKKDDGASVAAAFGLVADLMVRSSNPVVLHA